MNGLVTLKDKVFGCDNDDRLAYGRHLLRQKKDAYSGFTELHEQEVAGKGAALLISQVEKIEITSNCYIFRGEQHRQTVTRY